MIPCYITLLVEIDINHRKMVGRRKNIGVFYAEISLKYIAANRREFVGKYLHKCRGKCGDKRCI